ncbi:histamine H3 receptor-like, partial [Fundulus heteroclitus]|uniref:histamine H3 receptor-like n=1 Tax=Fundulus heteroclitus TaxID=8078 RepID=UPI00165BBE14
VSYRARQSRTHLAIVKIIAVWVLAFVLYGPAIIFWELVVGRSRVPKDECFAEFHYSWFFLLIASMLEFFLPLFLVAFFNLSIYLSLRRRWHLHREAQLQQRLQASEPASAQGESIPLSHNWRIRKKLPGRRPIHSQTSSPCLGEPDPYSSRAAQPIRLSRDKKIAKSLAIIVCVFVICWAPYTLLMIIRAACKERCIQHHWYEVTFWLLWLNSAINPFLYPLCHSSFRRAFSKVLCSKRNTTPPSSVPMTRRNP